MKIWFADENRYPADKVYSFEYNVFVEKRFIHEIKDVTKTRMGNGEWRNENRKLLKMENRKS